MGRTKSDYKRNSTSTTNKLDKARPRPKFQNGLLEDFIVDLNKMLTDSTTNTNERGSY